MSATQKSWRFDKTSGNFKYYDDFDGGDFGLSYSATTGCSVVSGASLDGEGYGCDNDEGELSLDSMGESAYDDLYLVVAFKIISEGLAEDSGFQIHIEDGIDNLIYSIGSDPTEGHYNLSGFALAKWYFLCLPISDDFLTTNAEVLALDYFAFIGVGEVQIDWWGIFRSSAFSDDYCISCKCGTVNDVDSGIRDVDNDDCYLETTNSDITIEEAIDVDSNNAKLTIYGTLGSGMRLKVTISWEISSSPQTDVVLYTTTLPYSFDLAVECPSIDKITKIVIENVLIP